MIYYLVVGKIIRVLFCDKVGSVFLKSVAQRLDFFFFAIIRQPMTREKPFVLRTTRK